jgi:hypothetical protein
MSKHLFRIAFVAGLAVIAWVAATALRTNPLAVAMTVLIGAFYLMGALELWRHRQATAALDTALKQVAEPPASIADWLARVPADLRDVVRLRIDGERVALPGPALAPTLAGLLVLLGMLGTFLGMVVTLSGTGVALERATDLQTMRDSLAAPVKGLGLAFGTSVAGVAASAMLGLMSALCRRERLQVAQRLDTRIATTLHGFTRAHQRQEAFRLLQQQAQLMPALVEQLQATMARQEALARQSGEQLLASQERFQAQTESAYRGLASSVDETLRQSLSESARIAAATIQPAVDATMQGIARETTALCSGSTLETHGAGCRPHRAGRGPGPQPPLRGLPAWCRPPHPRRRAPRPRWWRSCAERSATAWRATTPCWRAQPHHGHAEHPARRRAAHSTEHRTEAAAIDQLVHDGRLAAAGRQPLHRRQVEAESARCSHRPS